MQWRVATELAGVPPAPTQNYSPNQPFVFSMGVSFAAVVAFSIGIVSVADVAAT